MEFTGSYFRSRNQFMKVLLSRKMIKVLLYNCLMDWKVLHLHVTLQKKMVKPLVLMRLLSFMVIEFDRNDKRIVLSHTRLWEQEIEEEKQAEMKEKES